jgi:hypothetical protein
MSRRDLSAKGGTRERCYRTRRGRTDEQRYAIISPYFHGRIKMNGPYPEITNISFLAKLFFKTFISLKDLSNYRTIGPSDYRTVGLSDCRIIATAPLESVNNAKYLGCQITSDLRWSDHINNICGKANRTLGFLRRNLNIGSTSVKENAYKTLVRPTLEYASTVWDPYHQKDIQQLEMVPTQRSKIC